MVTNKDRACSRGCASCRPYLLLPHGLLQGCIWKFALYSACWLQEKSLLLCGSLLGCRELLLNAWSISFPPSALTLVHTGLILIFSLTAAM